jgi:hypothetical protein
MSPLFETMYSNSGQGDSNVKGGGRQVTMGGRQVATDNNYKDSFLLID